MEEMAGCAEKQLVDMLKTRPFTVQLDETTVRNSEALLLANVQYIENGEFHEEMLFCETLSTTTTARDIYTVFRGYLDK